MIIFFVLASFFISACGKKGPPTLKAYEKPQAPSGLTAIHREDKILLSWSYAGNLREALTGFVVLKSEAAGFERVGSVRNDQSSFIDLTFRPDVTYKYKVLAQNLKGVLSIDSNVITLTPRQVPPAPENIHFTVKGDGVALSWKSSGDGVCYNIYKTAEKGNYTDAPLNKGPECTTSFMDAAAAPDKSVHYTVRALHKTDIRDEGYASEEVEVSPSHFIPSPPADLRVVRGEDRVYLIWKESPEPWVKGYRVYRKKEGEQGITVLGESVIPTFTDTEKIAGKVWYMIKALGPVSESEGLVGEVK
jgi:fibronectin type 3 domain-containing protein